MNDYSSDSLTVPLEGGAFGRVLSTNIASPLPCPTGEDRISGINKEPQNGLSVFAPGPHYGDGSGVVGDAVGDSKHHGGADKAVYAFAREELDFWGDSLGQTYRNGFFGENLTSVGLDWTTAVINQTVRVGSAVLQVSVPRQPCRTFASWLDQRGWVKTFTAHGDCGAYFRVLQAGLVSPGDALIFDPAPEHGVTMGQAFRAKMGDKEAAWKVYQAHCLPGHHHEQLARLIGL